MLLLLTARHAPKRLEVGNHSRREEHCPSMRELGVIHAAAMHDLIFQRPGMGRFGIFLDISRNDGIAPPAHRHVKRRAGPARIEKTRCKPDSFDESFGLNGRFYTSFAVALPTRVAVLFDF